MELLRKNWQKVEDFLRGGFFLWVLGMDFFGPLIFKGGIGMANHVGFFFLIGLGGLSLLWMNVRQKASVRWADFPKVEALWLMLFVGLFGLSGVFSATQNVGWVEMVEIAAGFLLIFMGFFLAKKRELLEKFFGLINVGLAFSLAIGLVTFFVGHFERMSGSFQNYFQPWSAFPNAFGDFVLLVVPTTWYLYECKKGKRWGFAALFIMAVASVYLSVSKGVLLVGAGMLVLMVVRCFWRKTAVKFLLLSVVAGLVLGFGLRQVKNVLNPQYREAVVSDKGEKIDPGQFEVASSFSTRMEHYKVAVMLIARGPLFGYGPGSYPYVSAAHLPLLNTADHPHNLFLKVALENGIPTAAAWVLFLGWVLVHRLREFWRGEDGLREVVFLGVVAFLAHQLIDYNLQFTTILLVFFLWVGVLVVPRPVSLKAEKIVVDSVKAKGFWLVATSLIGVFSLVLLGFAGVQAGQKVLAKLQPGGQGLSGKGESGGEVWSAEDIEQGLRLNGYNAEMYAAKRDFQKAYELNPHDLGYLLGWYSGADEAGKLRLKPQVQEVLKQYLFLLKTNTNFTILTHNPFYAVALAEAIGDQELAGVLNAAFLDQRKKFSRFYGLKF